MFFLKPFLAAALIFTIFSGSAFAQIDSLANPRAYKELNEEQLGAREDDLGVANGHQVSEIVISDIEGEEVALNDLWSENALMIVFYRGGWCPYCNMQIRELSEDFAKFEEQGVLPVLISVDKPDVAALTTETYEIPFPVLSDQNLLASSEFNVVNKLSQQALDRAASRGRDFTEWSGAEHLSISYASSFLVDTNGVVQWSTVLKDHTSRPTVNQLLAAIADWKAAK